MSKKKNTNWRILKLVVFHHTFHLWSCNVLKRQEGKHGSLPVKVFRLSSLNSDWFVFQHKAKIPLQNANVHVGQLFVLRSRRSHRCFSFCVWSPRPAWQCSPCGTSSCACQACTRWPQRTPAPPWPAEHTPHTQARTRTGSAPSRGCAAVILPVWLADLWPVCHNPSCKVTCSILDKLEVDVCDLRGLKERTVFWKATETMLCVIDTHTMLLSSSDFMLSPL